MYGPWPRIDTWCLYSGQRSTLFRKPLCSVTDVIYLHSQYFSFMLHDIYYTIPSKEFDLEKYIPS